MGAPVPAMSMFGEVGDRKVMFCAVGTPDTNAFDAVRGVFDVTGGKPVRVPDVFLLSYRLLGILRVRPLGLYEWTQDWV